MHWRSIWGSTRRHQACRMIVRWSLEADSASSRIRRHTDSKWVRVFTTTVWTCRTNSKSPSPPNPLSRVSKNGRPSGDLTWTVVAIRVRERMLTRTFLHLDSGRRVRTDNPSTESMRKIPKSARNPCRSKNPISPRKRF